MKGPLAGLKVVELAGLGPAPFCGMVLADLGATVIRVDRAVSVVGGHTASTRSDLLNRGKQSVGLNLQSPDAADIALQLVADAEAIIEGFRPGVAERLGVGPSQCLARNKALVYGRMTGWGQEGPYSAMAGHDIDYIAVSGVLDAMGPSERPIPPLNLVGDFGGGGMLLAFGILAAVLAARESGVGQVVDAAMVDGSAVLSAMQHSMMAAGEWQTTRESNLLDGGAPFYTTYECADGRHVAVGALEPQFYATLLKGLGLDGADLSPQSDRSGWQGLREVFASQFLQKTRDEWGEHFSGTDACVAPILSMSEAPSHPHNVARRTFVDANGLTQPGPAPRFSKTSLAAPRAPVAPGADTDSIMGSLGYNPEQIGMLRTSGTIA